MIFQKRVFAVLLLLLAVTSADAQTQASTQPLYHFHDFSGDDGYVPSALIQGADGNFYGTTTYGGAHGSGAVFAISSGGAANLLHSFGSVTTHSDPSFTSPAATNSDGASPNGLVQDKQGNLWGIANEDGGNGNGTIFEIPALAAFRVVHTFSGYSYANGVLYNSDGVNPSALALGADGATIYGETTYGGANGNGVIFKVTSAGVFSVIHTFSVATPNGDNNPPATEDLRNSDGAVPQDSQLIAGPDGALYGETSEAGPNGLGTTFRITSAGAFTAFSGDGNGYVEVTQTAQTGGGSVQFYERDFTVSFSLGSDGYIYGANGSYTSLNSLATSAHDAIIHSGSLFRLSTSGQVTTLYGYEDTITPSTTTPVPYNPTSFLRSASGVFYGTNTAGGQNGYGGIFVLTPSSGTTGGYTETQLYQATASDAKPFNLIQATDNNLYALTDAGGGAVLEASNAPPPFVLHSFLAPSINPVGLTFGKDGNLYGVTYNRTDGGGIGSNFIVSVLSTPQTDLFRTLDDLGYVRPNTGSLLQALDGNFYGTTSQGDTLYHFAPDGAAAFSPNFPTGNDPDQGEPGGALIQGPNGVFYGVAIASNNYTGYVYASSGGQARPMVLHKFFTGASGQPDEGDNPYGQLLLASDGRLYGICTRGGLSSNSAGGTVYSLDPSKASSNYDFKVLHRFDSNSEGSSPAGGLVEGTDGRIYGTLNSGPGVFALTKSGTFSMTSSLPGARQAVGPLALDGIGNMYTLADDGSYGSIYQMTADGSTSRVIYQFTLGDGSTGSDPSGFAPLVLGPDGDMYGVAVDGGANSQHEYNSVGFYYNTNDYGVVFHLAVTRPHAAVTTSHAANVTSQITRTLAGQSRSSGQFAYAYTLKNTGAALSGPISVALDNLPSGVTLSNASGNTVRTTPTLSPYVLAASGGLAHNATVTVQLRFNQLVNAPLNNGTITFRILSGPGAL